MKKMRGFTLLETLVVFVLVALLSTLLIQGSGFLLSTYSRSERVQNDFYKNRFWKSWVHQVASGLAIGVSVNRVFKGETDGFTGFSSQALVGQAGKLTLVSLSVVKERDRWYLEYQQGNQYQWELFNSKLNLKFVYFDSDGEAHKDWDNSTDKRLPSRIEVHEQLDSRNSRALLILSPKARKSPKPDYRDYI